MGLGLGQNLAAHQLGQAEVEDLDAAVLGDEDVVRLEIAVDDALVVGRGEALGDLRGVVDRLAHRQRRASDALAQRLALEQLGDHERRAVVSAEIVDREDVRVVELAGGARLLLEATQPVGVLGEGRGQDLEGDLATDARVARAIHLAHAADAERPRHFVGSDLGSGERLRRDGTPTPRAA